MAENSPSAESFFDGVVLVPNKRVGRSSFACFFSGVSEFKNGNVVFREIFSN